MIKETQERVERYEEQVRPTSTALDEIYDTVRRDWMPLRIGAAPRNTEPDPKADPY